MNNTITSIECIRRCFVYDNGYSVPFSEIEEKIRKRTRNLHIHVYGYDDEENKYQPIVFIQADYEGYHYRTPIQKEIFMKKDVNGFYDFMAKQLAHAFGNKFFIGGEEE